MPDSSHPTTVSWRGSAIGEVLRVNVQLASADVKDNIWWGDWIFGSDGRYRMVKNVYCDSLTPGSVSLSFLGNPDFDLEDIGASGQLAVTIGGHGFTYEALLETWEIEAQVGELVRGSARFRLTGNV
jgi:hypothetical protein